LKNYFFINLKVEGYYYLMIDSFFLLNLRYYLEDCSYFLFTDLFNLDLLEINFNQKFNHQKFLNLHYFRKLIIFSETVHHLVL